MKPKTKINIAKKYVVQRNELLYGTTTVFNLNDLKIFKLIISKVNSKDPRFNEYYNITNEELKELNINHKHLYKTTLTTLKKLANVYMTIDTVENGQAIVKEVGLIQNNFKFRKYSNQFSISFHQDMKEYLLDIQEKYTRYPLSEISDLKLKHSLKFYEYLKSINFDELEITIEKLKKRLDIPITSYEKFAMFKVKVLEPAIKELNEKTALNVNFTPIKNGRKVTKIKFQINRNKPKIIEIDIHMDSDKLSKYLNKKFLHKDQEFKVTSIDKNENSAIVENLNSNELGKISGTDQQDLIERLEHLFNYEY